jgi:KDO2-lipid IV(A) lauroyltransferase
MRDLRYRAEAALVWFIYHFFSLLPLDVASALGGWIARLIGPRLAVSRLARDNLRQALPDLDSAPVIRAMWDNLGRCVGEFPHAERFCHDSKRLQIDGMHHVDALRDSGRPALLFSGHIGNWELTYALRVRSGVSAHAVYRAPDNPYLAWLFAGRVRRSNFQMIPKGPSGARQTIRLLNKGDWIALFVDQKMNDGISVPFFGRPAMTAPALATLAMKFDCPVIPFRIVRLKGAYFRAEILEPFRFDQSDDRTRDVEKAMIEVNRMLEGWIREYPAQWLWVHRRWPKQ